MNNTIGPDLPTAPEACSPPTLDAIAPPAPIPWGRWLRSFLATNPFYLLSAALLLYGIYRISTGPGWFATETAQLAFNFSSLQLYEILLVGTAILLARRAVWYDATLLAGLEHAFVFVPFILISQAALIEPTWVWGFCAVGVALAVARAGAAKSWMRNLNLPARALGCGALVLAVNAALPAIYRHLHESKIGTKLAAGAAYAFNEWSWLVLLPALILCATLIPKPRALGTLWPQRRWLPLGFFTLWLAATSTHLYSLGYVYDFDLRRELVAPALWALAWMLCLRITDFVPTPAIQLTRALLIVPVITPLIAGFTNNRVAFVLAGLNCLAYVAATRLNPQPRFARWLAVSSALIAIAVLPQAWGLAITPGFNPLRAMGMAVLGTLMFAAARSRNPNLGLVGACALADAAGSYLKPSPDAIHWALQAACVFLLLHSLRWVPTTTKRQSFARHCIATIWVLHAFVWAHLGQQDAVIMLAGLLVLGIWLVTQQLGWIKGLKMMPVAAALVVLSVPLDAAGGWVVTAPAGLAAVAGSFALFVAGTAIALTKHRWHPKELAPDE